MKMNDSGSTFIFMILISSITALGAMLLLNPLPLAQTQLRTELIEPSIQLVQANVQLLLANTQAWTHTIKDANNTTLQCLDPDLPSSNCDPAGGPFLIQLRDPANQIYIGTGTQGFSLGGSSCNNFDSVNGSDTCPFQIQVRWLPVCANGAACTNPQIQISSDLVFKPGPSLGKTSLNVARFRQTLMR